MIVPQSSTATYLMMSTAPVSVSTSLTQMWAPAGHVKFGGSYTAVARGCGSTPLGRSCACHAEIASSGIVRALSGAPFTVKEPPAVVEVLLGDLELVRRDRARLRDDLLHREVQRHAADARRPRSVRVHAERRDRRVAVQDLDVVGVHAEPVGHDLRPASSRAPARAGRCRSSPRPCRSGRHSDRGRVPAAGRVPQRAEDVRRRQPAHLDVGGQSDPELLRTSPRVAAACCSGASCRSRPSPARGPGWARSSRSRPAAP